MKLLTVSVAILMMIVLPRVDARAQAEGKWVKLAPFPEPAEELYGVAAGGKLYVIGGLAPGWKPMGLVYEYDPSADKWIKKKPMALPSHHVALAESNGKIYVIGGRVGAAFMAVPASNTDIVEEYDPAPDQWGALKAPMPTPRSAFAWGTYRGRIYVAGGEMRNAQAYGAYRAVEGYDPATNRWSILPPLLVPRHGLAGDVIGNRLHLVSGDVQSLGAIDLAGVHHYTDLHDAFEFAER